MFASLRYTFRISDKITVRKEQRLAEQAHRNGDFAEAIRLQGAIVDQLVEAGEKSVDARKLLSLYCYSAGDYLQALQVLDEIRKLAPEDIESLENTGVILRLLGRQEESVKILRQVFEQDSNRVNVCDALAHSYANLKDHENCQKFGRLSLELKDGQAAETKPLVPVPGGSPPPFAAEGPKKNVISFSLWGANPRYTKGAIRNTQAAIDVYPGWTVRFYCDDSVPPEVIGRLRNYGAEVVMRSRPATFFDGLLWRFEVIEDPEVDRFLVRDCDSVVNVKERVAVEEWLHSDRWFHVMRDFPSHTEVILAGMWGGISGVLPTVQEIRDHFRPTTAPTRTFDQQLLREVVWPIIRQSVLCHDSVYTGCLGSVPFPQLATLPSRYHVGQNEAAVRKEVFVDMPAPARFGTKEVFLLSGLDEEAVSFCRRLIDQLKEISVVAEPTIPKLRELVSESLQAIDPEAAEERRFSKAREEILLALMGASLELIGGGEVQCVGFEDPNGDIPFLSSLAASANLKLLCVVRDPRDTASSRRITEVEDGVTLAKQWNEHIQAVARVNKIQPDSVELVRYEDLSAGRSGASIGRLCKFLGLQIEGETVRAPGIIDSGKPLPDEISQAIREEASNYLKRLQYIEPSVVVSAAVSEPVVKDG
ncbi:MAG: sulfotransferase domain-containing protein [Verrucomicrobiales bacterium]|nr:sulfotransferase domain-containing protein [Verrucomicrobiales bacterium]